MNYYKMVTHQNATQQSSVQVMETQQADSTEQSTRTEPDTQGTVNATTV